MVFLWLVALLQASQKQVWDCPPGEEGMDLGDAALEGTVGLEVVQDGLLG